MSRPVPDVVQIVLAAGAGTRMGGNKALLALGGRPILERLLDAARTADLPLTLVVVGAEGDAVARLCGRPRARAVPNPDFALGQTSSLQAGLRALPDWAAAFLVHPVDHALVGPADLRALVDAFAAADAADRATFVARPRCGDAWGHPVLFARSFLAEFLAVPPTESARVVYRRHLARVRAVDVADDASLFDLDTPADLAAAERRLARPQGGPTT